MATSNQILIDEPTARYDGISRFLHWLTLTLLIAQFALGWLMPDADSVKSPEGLVAWHIGVGTSLLVVILIRFVWSLIRKNPGHIDQSQMLRVAARTVHIALYALLVGVPVLGWLNANGRAWLVQMAGVWPLPQIATPESLGASIGEWHSASAIVLLILIGLHIVGALTHQFSFRGGILRRML